MVASYDATNIQLLRFILFSFSFWKSLRCADMKWQEVFYHPITRRLVICSRAFWRVRR